MILASNQCSGALLLNSFLFFNYRALIFGIINGVIIDNSLICRAATIGNIYIVKYLYETCHANVETKDNVGFTPINNASSNGHLEVVKYLHETCRVDVETKDEYGRTPINNASKNGHLDVVKLCKVFNILSDSFFFSFFHGRELY